MAVAVDAIVVQDAEPRSVMLDGRVVLLSVRTGAYFTLNEVGSAIWNLLAEPRTLTQIRDVLIADYDANVERVEKEIASFVQSLVDNRLAVVMNSPPR